MLGTISERIDGKNETKQHDVVVEAEDRWWKKVNQWFYHCQTL